MPVAHKNDRIDVQMQECKERFVNRVRELFDEHIEKITATIESKEDKKLNVSFVCELDFSESSGSCDTAFGYGVQYRDRRHDDIDPPEQQQIPGTERESLVRVVPHESEEEEPKPKKPRKKKEAAED